MNILITKFQRREISPLFAQAKGVKKTDFCKLRVSKTEYSFAKFLIIIPKKCGNAPYRNYIRRCTKETIRAVGLLNIKKHFIITYFPSSTVLTFGVIKKFLHDAQKKLL